MERLAPCLQKERPALTLGGENAMRISRFRALTLAGLLGLALTSAASAAGAADKACLKDPDEPKAAQLADCNGGFADRQHLAQVYRQRLGLAADTAVRLADALAGLQALDDRRSGEGEPAFEQEIRQVESQFISLLDQAPDDPEIADDVSWFYGREVWYSRVPSTPLLDLVARSADPARIATRLTKRGFSKADAEILLAALSARPESAVLWHHASQLTYNLAWKIALLEEACRQLPSGAAGRPSDAAAATALAEELLETELDAGLAPQALATFQSLPPKVRSRIEQGSEGTVKAEIGGLPFEGRSRDLRRPLVAAYLLGGDNQAAARLLAKIKPVPAAKQRGDAEARDGELERQVLARWLHPSADDPFDVLTAALPAKGPARRAPRRWRWPAWPSGSGTRRSPPTAWTCWLAREPRMILSNRSAACPPA